MIKICYDKNARKQQKAGAIIAGFQDGNFFGGVPSYELYQSSKRAKLDAAGSFTTYSLSGE